MNPAGMTTQKHLEVKLECQHSLWFIRSMLPKPGDTLWCKKCDEYTAVYPSHANIGTMYMDTWKSEPRKHGFLGTCMHDGCDFTEVQRNWHTLELKLHVHYMRTHTRFGSTLVIEVVDRLPPNSPPPF